MTGSDAEAVRAASDALAAAIVANDAEALEALLGDEWRLVGADGAMTRRRFIALVRSGELTHSMMRPVGEVEVRVYDDTAVLSARVVNTAEYAGTRYDADEWTTDVFVRRDGAWVCVHSHVTAVSSA